MAQNGTGYPFEKALAEAQRFISVSELARQTGVSRRQLYRLKDGEFMPRPITRRAIETVLGMSIVFPKEGSA